MRTTTPASPTCLRLIFRLLTALLVLGATASCSSGQLAFRFRPAPPVPMRAVAAASAEPEAAAPPAQAPAQALVQAPTAAQPFEPQAQKPTSGRPGRLRYLARPVAALTHSPAASAAQAVAKSRVVGAPAKVRRVFAPQRPAEVGLGTTVLGVLGLVVLPVSLLGLLIWGGPVWLVLAGLSALAVLIAYLDPFG